MGISAVVFRRLKDFDRHPNKDLLFKDEETGQVYSSCPDAFDLTFQETVSCKARIGNLSNLIRLREEVAKLLGPNSFIELRILQNGPPIGADGWDCLSDEAKLLQKRSELVPCKELADNLLLLCKCAADQGNPIVLV